MESSNKIRKIIYYFSIGERAFKIRNMPVISFIKICSEKIKRNYDE